MQSIIIVASDSDRGYYSVGQELARLSLAVVSY